ncbi:hypothetical protein HanIR_Chr07g0336551 [Helianthus annuus]|nr:hypothetical protein HanIR_Chr07g0336551 [Helianthus annuus]
MPATYKHMKRKVKMTYSNTKRKTNDNKKCKKVISYKLKIFTMHKYVQELMCEFNRPILPPLSFANKCNTNLNKASRLNPCNSKAE